MTVSLFQAQALRLTSVLLKVAAQGLEHDQQPVAGAAMLAVDQVADLGWMLTGLAEVGAVWKDRQSFCQDHGVWVRRNPAMISGWITITVFMTWSTHGCSSPS